MRIGELKKPGRINLANKHYILPRLFSSLLN
jgi:hypothetical protein